MTLLFALLMMVQTQEQPLLIPFVDAGSEVWVVNGADPQEVLVLMPGTPLPQRYPLKQWESVTIQAKFRGYVRIGRRYPVLAWSVVAGTVFQARLADSVASVFAATPQTGISIANPFGEPVAFTFWIFDSSSQSSRSINDVIPALGHVVDYVSRWTGPVKSNTTVVLASAKPIVIGVARCMTPGACESIPAATIK